MLSDKTSSVLLAVKSAPRKRRLKGSEAFLYGMQRCRLESFFSRHAIAILTKSLGGVSGQLVSGRPMVYRYAPPVALSLTKSLCFRGVGRADSAPAILLP